MSDGDATTSRMSWGNRDSNCSSGVTSTLRPAFDGEFRKRWHSTFPAHSGPPASLRFRYSLSSNLDLSGGLGQLAIPALLALGERRR